MKRIWLLTIAAGLILSGCNGQDSNTPGKEKHEPERKSNAPKTDVKVNKEYDSDGNLIRYDSTYTYYYSNIDEDDRAADSILGEFKTGFHHLYPFSCKPYFNDLFFEDSLMNYDFYKDNFFEERFKRNMLRMDKLFQEMDSIKNSFFMKQFPESGHEKESKE